MKKTIILLLISALFFSLSPLTFAAKSSEDIGKFLEEANNYVSEISTYTDYWNNAKVKYEFPLYDFDGYISSYLFTVKEKGDDKGYIIISNTEEPKILESTREGSHPYGNVKAKEKALYVGPTMYYVELEEPDTYFDVRSKKNIEKKNLKGKGTLNAGSEENKELMKLVNRY